METNKLKDYFIVDPSKNTNKYDDYINYIDTSSVVSGELMTVQYLTEDFPSRANKRIEKDDILYSSVRPILKHFYHYENVIDHAIASTGFCVIRNKNKDNYSTKFLYYYLSTNQIVSFLDNIAQNSQATFPSFSKKDLENVDLPDISLPTQHRIAAILSSYDALIQNYKRQIAALQSAASELYKEWFVRFRFPGYKNAKFDNGLPEGWKVETVKNTFEIFDTQRIPVSSLDRANMDKKYPYYGAAELMDYIDNYLFDGIYLLMGEDGSVITPKGKPVLQYVWGKFWVNNHAHVLQGKGLFSTEFLHLMFSEMDVTGIVTGVAQPKISQGRLFGKKTILPEKRIIEKFDTIIQPMYSKIRKLNNAITNLTTQRDLLLPRLMSGKLSVE